MRQTATRAALTMALFALPDPVMAARPCRVAIDVGHSESRPGAMSARGVPEYVFNRRIADLLVEELRRRGLDGFLVVETSGERDSLQTRTRTAEGRGADMLVSIHHDSVQPSYLRTWRPDRVDRGYSDRFSGFSLFVSTVGSKAPANLALGRAIGAQLLNAGFRPTLHHAEPIPGEGRRLIDPKLGLYAFDDLVVLKTASMPAVLVECGVIVNRVEEVRLGDPARQRQMVSALAAGIIRACSGAPHARPSP